MLILGWARIAKNSEVEEPSCYRRKSSAFRLSHESCSFLPHAFVCIRGGPYVLYGGFLAARSATGNRFPVSARAHLVGIRCGRQNDAALFPFCFCRRAQRCQS